MISVMCFFQTTEVISELEGKINHYKQSLEDSELQRKRDLRVSQTFVIILCCMVLGKVETAIFLELFLYSLLLSWKFITET